MIGWICDIEGQSHTSFVACASSSFAREDSSPALTLAFERLWLGRGGGIRWQWM